MLKIKESPWKNPEDRKQERALKQEAVLTTAARIFADRGYHRASLDLVAEALNVTKPTLYYYFKNKEAMLSACMSQGLEIIENQTLAMPADNRSSALDILSDYLEKYARFVMTDFGRCAILISDTELSEASKKSVRSMKSRIDHKIRSIIQSGVEDGTIISTNPKFTAAALAGAINSIAHWSYIDNTVSKESIISEYVELLLVGVVPRVTAHP